jgi:hypothetical protein
MSAVQEQTEELMFDPETHIYCLDGAPVPSVTQVLNESGLIDTTYFKEYHRWRGSAVHLACWYLDQDDLDESTVPGELQGYLDAYKAFRSERDFVIESIEAKRVHRQFGYAGTVDRTGLFEGLPTTLDLKTGAPLPAYRIQLAAYCFLMPQPWQQRINLQLSKDGKYKIHVYPMAELKRDFDIFLAGLTITNWKRGNNL